MPVRCSYQYLAHSSGYTQRRRLPASFVEGLDLLQQLQNKLLLLISLGQSGNTGLLQNRV